MTVPRWDAQKWHEERTRAPAPAKRPRKLAISLVAAALCLGAAAASVSAFSDTERVGICHANGAGDYVYLEVDKNGYEHGHHRHHEHDFFVAPGQGCSGSPLGGNETAGEAGNETLGNETVDDTAGNETEETAGNETVDDTAGNETATPEGNETAPANETVPAGDAYVRQQAVQDGDLVVILLTAGNAGEGVADVELSDSLPDVRRTWYLGGADASQCVLDGRELSCWFGELAPGQTRQVELRSYTDRMPCGFSMTNTALVSAPGDTQPRNDASSASILARPC